MAGKKKKITKHTERQIESLGKRLREIRMKAGFSGSEHFAYDYDISRTQYAKYETGTDMNFSTLMGILEAFDITAAEFFSEGFDVEKKSEGNK